MTMSLIEMINAAGSPRVVSTRARLWQAILPAARAGELSPDWRDSLTIADAGIEAAVVAEAVTGDADSVALHEVVTSPAARWEPYAANGDWRQALSAWRDASLNALEVFECAFERHWADLMAAGAGRALQKWAPNTFVDRFASQMLRDQIGAQFRAGLAAGGDDVDWLAWYRDRVAAWDTTGADYRIALKQGMLETLANRAEAAQQANWEFLPDYWTRARPE